MRFTALTRERRLEMSDDKIAVKTVLLALAIGIAVWATTGAPEPGTNSPLHVATRR
ncbi:hypothetical protein BEL01nite_80660 [Bradyrhizobium elkanii]|nr:hypothetical protein BEL01nite_80660 [Bradyrhizobium elkanii]